MIKKGLLLLLIIVVFTQAVDAILCNYNTRPYIKDGITKDKIYWNCYNISADKCVSYVSFDEDIIQTNPTPQYIAAVGLVDKFDVQNSVANIYFRGRDLREGKNVTFGVRCEDEVLEQVVTPQYKPMFTVIDRADYSQDQMGYYVGMIFGVIGLLIIISVVFVAIRSLR